MEIFNNNNNKGLIVWFAFKNSYVVPMSYTLDRREENQLYTLSENKYIEI